VFWPMKRGHIVASGFGPRDGGFHYGTDFGWPGGSGGLPVYAPQAGVIDKAGPASGFGWWVCIDHPADTGGGYTVLGHVIPEVQVGEGVQAGQRVARINPDSRTNGGVPPHVHVERHRYIWSPPGPDRLNPLAVLDGAAYPDESSGGVMVRGLDFAGGRPGAWNVQLAGFDFVVRYLSDGGPGLPGKQLLPREADDYRTHGVGIVSNWETYADRMRGGWQSGVDDAHAALAQVLACGGRRDRPIYFSADWDASAGEQGAIDDYLRGAATVIGPENTGIYGGYWVVKRCLDNGTARWAWQAQAWSGGNEDPRINILQLNNAGYADVGGVQCDVNEARTTDYGQWSPTEGDAPMSAAEVKQVQDFVAGFCGPIGSDVKDIREQLAGQGQRDGGQYAGWPQLGGKTVVDAVAEILARLDRIEGK
jgi:hypothetical protein